MGCKGWGMGIDEAAMSILIGAIYDAAHDPLAWPVALETLRETFNGSKACIARNGPDVGPNDHFSSACDPAYIQKFIREHAGQANPLADAIAGAGIGEVYSDHRLVGHEAMRQSRFWNEWMAPQDMYGGLGCKLVASGPSYWFVDVQRGRNQPAFDAGEAACLDQLVPHIDRAARIARAGRVAGVMGSVFDQLSFGVLILDAAQNIAFMNASAEELIARPASGFVVKAGAIAPARAASAQQFSSLIVDACRRDGVLPGIGGDVLVTASRAGEPERRMVVSVSPLMDGLPEVVQGIMQGGAPNGGRGNYALVFLRELTLDLTPDFAVRLRTLFGLAPKEANLAAVLTAGVSLKDAAEQCGIRISTARSYLENIFDKVGVRQQSHLVAVLKTVQPMLRRP